jgi:hypothetical protein
MVSGSAVAERDEAQLPAVASESAAILSLIERMATNPEISPERVERFIAMHDGMEAKRSKLAFSNAIAQAKAKIAETPIIKNATGHNSKRYADFSAYAKVVDPVLASFGLTYRFRTVQSDKITVTCVLTGHGHEEENSLSGPADASGSKNAIQAIGSTLTYLQRYTLVQALGLAAADDDDGKAAGANSAITEDQVEELQALIDKAVEAKGGDRAAWLAAFLEYMKVDGLIAIPARDFGKAKSEIEHAIRQGKK